MKKMWKDIPGYEGLYKISSDGEVMNRYGKALALDVSQKGYLRVRLSKDGKWKNHKVHRLVAMAFIPNPYNYPQINHIDEDKMNNSVSNLEWVDNKTNNILKSTKSVVRKVAVVYDNNIVARIFNSANEAARFFGVSRYGILSACKGIQHSASGLKWRFAE